MTPPAPEAADPDGDVADRPAGPRVPRPVLAAGLAALLVLVAVEATRVLAPPVTPVDVGTVLDAPAIARATAFRGPLRTAAVAALGLRIAVAAVLVAWAVRRGRRAGVPPATQGWRGVLATSVAAAAAWAATDLLRLPIGLWAWRRAADVGLSTQSAVGWLRDWGVQVGLQWLAVAVAVAGAVVLRSRLRRRPRGAAAWGPLVGLLGGLLGAVLVVASPVVLEPLLLDVQPLPAGALRDQVLQVAARAGLDPIDVVVGDASRRTTGSNAYVSGLGLPGLGTTRRIVLFDTLVRDAPPAEVIAVVAHEVAHDRHRDIERAAVQLVALGVLLGCALQVLLDPVARGRARPHHAVLAVGVVVLLLAVLGPVERWSSRRAESAADAAAIALTEDPATYRSMLTGLAVRNLADPDPPRWAVVLFGSHPDLASRVARAHDDAVPTAPSTPEPR